MATPTTVSTLLLRQVSLFAMLPERQLAALASVVSRRSVPRSTTIIANGEVTDSLYVVISGRLKVTLSDDGGREVILSMLGDGEYFGDMELIDDSARSASVVSVERCELMVLSKRDFRQCLAENAEMSMAVMRSLVRRLRDANRKIGSLALRDVHGRVAHQLLAMSETIDGQHVVTRKVAKQDIAKMIGASREMVSRVMKELQVGGFIEFQGNSIYLRDNIAAIG